MDFEAVVLRIRAEFIEMPGLRLTVPQASRLWGLDASVCEAVIEALVTQAFLRRTSSGLLIHGGV